VGLHAQTPHPRHQMSRPPEQAPLLAVAQQQAETEAALCDTFSKTPAKLSLVPEAPLL